MDEPKLVRSLWIVTWSMFISMLAFGIVVPLLPIYAQQLGATGFQVGAIFAGFSVALVFSLPIIGVLSDTFGRKVFLCLGVIGLSLSSLFFIWAKSPLQLVLIRSIQGIFAAMHLPVAQAYVGDITPEGNEGRWMGKFNAVLFASLGAGPVLGGMVTDFFGLKVTFSLMSLLLFIAFLFTLIALPETRIKKQKANPINPLFLVLRSRVMKAAFLFQLCHGLCLACHMVLLPLFMTGVLKSTPSLVGLAISARSPVSFLQVYTGRLADRYDKRKLTVVGMVMFGLFTMLVPFSTTFTFVVAFYALAMLGITLSVPAVTALVLEEGRDVAGTSFSVFLLPLNVGASLGSMLFGRVSDFIGLKGTFLYAGLLPICFSLLFYLVIGGRTAFRNDSAKRAPS